MNVRLKKEFTALFWPWLMIAAIGLLPLINWALLTAGLVRTDKFIYFLANSTYVIGVVLLAAIPIGMEFQERTWTSLFSQPCTRSQILRDKLLVSTTAILTVTLLHIIGCLPKMHWLQTVGFKLLPCVLLGLSAGFYWSLVSRSTLGGVIMGLCSQAIFVSIVVPSLSPAFIAGLTLLLSIILIVLTWKRFVHLEYTGSWETEADLSPRKNHRSGRTFFPSIPNAPLRNLVVKELFLLRPVIILILLFSTLSVLAISWATRYPESKLTMKDLIDQVAYLYVPIVLLLSGCLSLGSEKSLGIHVANLASPVSPRRQWLLKNALASMIGLSGTLVLFYLLPLLPGRNLNLTFVEILAKTAPYWGLVCASVFMVIQFAFWAATVANRTVHAFFLAISAMLGFGALFQFGLGIGSHLTFSVQPIVDWLIARQQLSQWAAESALNPLIIWGFLLSSATLIHSGWQCFRRSQNEQANLKQSLKVPLLIVLLTGAISGSMQKCVSHQSFQNSDLYQETKTALLLLKQAVPASASNDSRSYSTADLANTGALSPRTQAWLRDSTVTLVGAENPSARFVVAVVNFPGGDRVQPISLRDNETLPPSFIKLMRDIHDRKKP